MNFSIARQYFYQEIQQDDSLINLERTALYIAWEEYPDLDVEAYMNALDTMAVEVAERLPQERYPMRMIQSINRYLYDDLGFRGNTTEYYDPRNSFLNQVIDRRVGIPITLSLVYLAIAQRLDFPMVGVGMPGHFLIRPDLPNVEIFVDVFNAGEVLFPQDCQERLTQLYGQPIRLRPQHLPTVTNQQLIARLLMNLKATYLNQTDLHRALAVVERLLLLLPEAVLELRDRGILYYHLNRFAESQRDLQAYLAQAPQAEDAIAVRHLLEQMQQNSVG